MKRIVIFLLFFSVVFSGYAESTKGPRIDVGVGAGASIFSRYLYVNPELLYDFGLIAVGGGINTVFGLDYSGIYAAPYGEFEIGWFYLDLGVCLGVKDPDKDGISFIDTDNKVMPYASLGMAAPLFSIGPGKIGLDLSVDILPTPSPVVVEDSSDSFFANFIASLIFSVYGYAFNAVKAGFSLFYTMGL